MDLLSFCAKSAFSHGKGQGFLLVDFWPIFGLGPAQKIGSPSGALSASEKTCCAKHLFISKMRCSGRRWRHSGALVAPAGKNRAMQRVCKNSVRVGILHFCRPVRVFGFAPEQNFEEFFALSRKNALLLACGVFVIFCIFAKCREGRSLGKTR